MGEAARQALSRVSVIFLKMSNYTCNDDYDVVQ